MSINNTFMLTLDYEIFFGSRHGTPQHCLIQPTDALAALASDSGLKLCLFVDAGYLSKLKQLAPQSATHNEAFNTIAKQLRRLIRDGHDVQLHIHPHWETTAFEKDSWVFDYQHYRLQSLDEDHIARIVKEYKSTLEAVAECDVFAYRAGGWCLQPFSMLEPALKQQEIWLDSTVYSHGYNPDPKRYFDFRGAPNQSHWRFNSDPLTPENEGYFLEIPISTQAISPLFFWKMALYKKLNGPSFKNYGDGSALSNDKGYYIQRLTQTTYSPVSIDGIKGRLLESAYRYHQKTNSEGCFNVMGHPKSITPDSIKQLGDFLAKHQQLQRTHFREMRSALEN